MGRKREVYDKTNAVGHFFRLPTEIRHYVYLPKYKAEMSYLYALLVDFYNTNHGYAFPSEITLAFNYGKTEKTTAQHLGILEEYGLVKIIRTKGKVSKYIPIKPLPVNQLFEDYPIARDKYEERERKAVEERERNKENLRNYLDRIEW
jgi:replication initiation and membrane attachment protein DnaB